MATAKGYEQVKVEKRKSRTGTVTIAIPNMHGESKNYIMAQIQDMKRIGFTDWKESEDGLEWIATAPIEAVERHKAEAEALHFRQLRSTQNRTRAEQEAGAFSSTLDQMDPVSIRDFMDDAE